MKYRKKPIVIEAFQMTKDTIQDPASWPYWLTNASNLSPKDVGSMTINQREDHPLHPFPLLILTLEGYHEANENDWIIQGIQSELYPCKPDIFEATYDVVETETP